MLQCCLVFHGVLLAVIPDDERSRANFHSIDYNYFGVRLPLASNGGKIIRVVKKIYMQNYLNGFCYKFNRSYFGILRKVRRHINAFNFHPPEKLNVCECVRKAISPLLSNLYLHVVFDGWMLQNYPGIRFERYADEIIIHARREQIAQSILHKLYKRFTECGLTIHPTKTRIVCLTRNPLNKDVTKVHSFEMGGFVFTPQWVKEEGEWKLMILPSPSVPAKKGIMDKIRSLRLHTRTGSIYVVANLLNPRQNESFGLALV